ncbi:hypothetical protein M405DRAFT_155887 [Rhizopogon salebrosus TDB-379]|nr:hypothetical protein M405DRAFT_939198 [Rhizopogon salebrosus TDB-379]KAJ8579408.1 hypothetical protein M405DRAFT_155887 [Rhizopogon salebrosus TDB-379]
MHDSNETPRYYYRVVDDKSHCKYEQDKGFVASIPNAVYNPSHWKAKRELERHMDWGNRHPTPFISVTASRKQAIHYALQRVEWGNGSVLIAKIDHSRLKEARICIYRACDLVRDTGAEIKVTAENSHEYLCVRHIPVCAVISILILDDEDGA